MRKIFSIAVLIAGLSQWPVLGSALADDDSPSDSRIKLLMYNEADVYTITTRYGYQTNIVFAPNEEIDTISVGDRSVWQIIPAGNRLFIRPMDEDVITNMTILTNKHSYQFDLKSVPADKTSGNIYVAKFVYPDEKKKTPEIAEAIPASASAPAGASAETKTTYIPVPSPFGYGPSVGPGSPQAAKEETIPPTYAAPAPMQSSPEPEMSTADHPNYNYTYSGSDEAAPLQVYDDGKYTYIKYRTLMEPLPKIFTVDPAGNETPVTYSTKGNFIRVNTVVGELSLKTKNDTVHIFNETINPR